MRLFITTAVAGLALTGAASAQTTAAPDGGGQYVSIAGGVIGKTDYNYRFSTGGTRLDAELDAGPQGALAWGASVGANWRAELALGYRSQDISSWMVLPGLGKITDGGKADTLSLDINAYYDFPVSGPVKPYLGAGVGVAQVKIDDGALDDKAEALNMQAIAGASVAISPNVSLFAEGRYQRTGPIRITATLGAATKTSNIDLSSAGGLVGVRFGF